VDKTLVIGDVHAVPQELPDCEALVGLIVDSVKKHKCETVLFLGDSFHTHDILNSRVIDFWLKTFKRICSSGANIITICGNHDQLTPTIRSPHALEAFKNSCIVVDSPIQHNDCCFMPYYWNPEEFVEEAVKLKDQNPDVETLFCHQTFMGADGGLGYLSKDSVEPSAVPFKRVLSGHIHTPMKLGKVWYIGAPRWRTLSDADIETRNLYVLEQGKTPLAISTNTHCVKIYKFEDSEDQSLNIKLTQDELTRSDIRITINGSSAYISKRMLELKAQYNAKCRGVPIRNKLAKASESEGIQNAFIRFGSNFNPPNGTDREFLLKETYGRM
jgi:DNA repair exonuclease SbcCD nuclease subunit